MYKLIINLMLNNKIGYSTHKCSGTYIEDSAKRDKVAEIERYQHYSERYDAHINSSKLEVSLHYINY